MKKRGDALVSLIFFCYCTVVLWYTLFSRTPMENAKFKPELFWEIRMWIDGDPIGKEETLNFYKNIIFFLPFGFLFPKEKWGWKGCIITVLLFSATIEFAQFVTKLGWGEVDDVISNTFGALLGYVLFQAIKRALQFLSRLRLMQRKQGIYEKCIKRIIDICCAIVAILVFGWLYIIIAVLVRVKLGSPVLFKQPRPGKDEKIFNLYKFRSMTNERDENGNLMPDNVRLTKFGKALRASSMDELPEAFNILKGDMSVIGDSEIIGTTKKNLDFTRVSAA